jgi:hypothetical protein
MATATSNCNPVYQDQLTAKKLTVNGKTFEWDKDYSFGITNADWKYNEFAFAGYGNYDSAKNINDFAGLDLKGKVVVFLETPTARVRTCVRVLPFYRQGSECWYRKVQWVRLW